MDSPEQHSKGGNTSTGQMPTVSGMLSAMNNDIKSLCSQVVLLEEKVSAEATHRQALADRLCGVALTEELSAACEELRVWREGFDAHMKEELATKVELEVKKHRDTTRQERFDAFEESRVWREGLEQELSDEVKEIRQILAEVKAAPVNGSGGSDGQELPQFISILKLELQEALAGEVQNVRRTLNEQQQERLAVSSCQEQQWNPNAEALTHLERYCKMEVESQSALMQAHVAKLEAECAEQRRLCDSLDAQHQEMRDVLFQQNLREVFASVCDVKNQVARLEADCEEQKRFLDTFDVQQLESTQRWLGERVQQLEFDAAEMKASATEVKQFAEGVAESCKQLREETSSKDLPVEEKDPVDWNELNAQLVELRQSNEFLLLQVRKLSNQFLCPTGTLADWVGCLCDPLRRARMRRIQGLPDKPLVVGAPDLTKDAQAEGLPIAG